MRDGSEEGGAGGTGKRRSSRVGRDCWVRGMDCIVFGEGWGEVVYQLVAFL